MININNTPWSNLTAEDIKALLCETDGETFFFEFKKDDVRNEKIYKEISAFANTFGGYILLGISDDKTVTGCSNWTEQRIHNVIYNGITPLPDFDVKSFVIDGKTVLVIKIEEGPSPPYITTDGKICERVSSGSMQIKDSAKLSQLYAKYKDQLQRLDNKIGHQDLYREACPVNLCAYLDVGFEIRCRDSNKVIKDFHSFDFTPIGEYLKKKCPVYSVSRVGSTFVITIGEFTQSYTGEKTIFQQAAMHNYMVLMGDGSAKFRICLLGEDNGSVNLRTVSTVGTNFLEIYKQIFKMSLEDNFIYARRYEKLTVLKQFTPFYDNEWADVIGFDITEHTRKYQSSIVVSSTRTPYDGYLTIDKRYISEFYPECTIDNVIETLFTTALAAMGFVDIPDIIKTLCEERIDEQQ